MEENFQKIPQFYIKLLRSSKCMDNFHAPRIEDVGGGGLIVFWPARLSVCLWQETLTWS